MKLKFVTVGLRWLFENTINISASSQNNRISPLFLKSELTSDFGSSNSLLSFIAILESIQLREM